MIRLRASLALTGIVMFTASLAPAWDSVTRPGVRNQRSTSSAFPSGPSTGKFRASVLKDSIGGRLPDGSDDTSINNLLVCDASLAGMADGSNLSGCVPATTNDLSRAEWGWLEIRKAADLPNRSEHYLIAQAAASFAGFSKTTLFAPFWLRYPTRNGLVASARDLDENGYAAVDPTPSPLLVGQSWLPASDLINATQALRSISLLEIAELPDFSNSLADWAAGNELCPVPNVDGAFTSDLSSMQACHAFKMVLGAINATHFAPLNRQTWTYYHALAIKRMTECKKLSALVQPFYSYYDVPHCPPMTPQNVQNCDYLDESYKVLQDASETGECESEAMTYEMFAQHFLQDAWSTGHMWKRWGKANFDEFDSDFPLEVAAPAPSFPLEDSNPRRTAIALFTGAIAGEIHGAKAMAIKLARDHLGNGLASLANFLGAADDPLNGPSYFVPSIDPLTGYDFSRRMNVEWRTGADHFPGAGDLFWDPDPAPLLNGVVSSSSTYADQRTDLIKCSAASMRAVYDVGPHSHGVPSDNSLLTDVDPGGDNCWDHWATNEAMLGAFGAVSFIYDPAASLFTINTVNTAIVDAAKPSIGFVRDSAPDTGLPNYAARRADRELFLARLRKRLNSDIANLQSEYSLNAKADPKGTASAHGIDLSGAPITMLGVGPIPDPVVAPPDLDAGPPPAPEIPAPTKYSDKLTPQGTDPGSLDAAGTLGSALSKVFWRGNIERTCRTSLQNGAHDILALRDKCISNAATGGNPDACTACVELASLHVPKVFPTLGPAVNAPVLDSKCSAIGVYPTATPQSGLPSYWYDSLYRNIGLDENNVPPYQEPFSEALWFQGFYVAMQWCTGTEVRRLVGENNGNPTFEDSDNDWLPDRDSLLSWDNAGTTFCPEEGSPTDGISANYGTFHRRRAQAFIEDFSPNSGRVFPIVTAFNYDVSLTPSGAPCGVTVTDSRLEFYKRLVSPALLTDFDDIYGGAAGIVAPRCGVQQRVFSWGVSCADAAAKGKYSPPARNQFFPATGEEMDENGSSCYVHEPRTFRSDCPLGLTCNADGECNSPSQPPTVDIVTARARVPDPPNPPPTNP